MYIEKELREEFNRLSKEVFGVSSKWKGLLDHGQKVLVTEKVTETIPGENGAPDETKTVEVAVKQNGVNVYTVKYYTVEEIHQLLLDYKKNRDDMIARIEAGRRQKETEEKVMKEATGRTTVG